MSTPQRILIIGTVWPEPDSSAAGVRMMQLIRLFLSKSWVVTFACAASKGPYSYDLQAIHVEVADITLNDSHFDTFVRSLDPSVVLFDRFMIEEQFGWRVAEQCPGAIRILDTEDLHCLRRARQKAFKESRDFKEEELLTTEVARREIASILRCDMSLIISSYELELLKRQFRIDPELLYYIPFMTERLEEEVVSSWLPFSERVNFLSIGNFLHEPNCDSVIFLKEAIWPVIRKSLPKAELHIYGAYPSPKILQLNKPGEGFLIKGRAENAKVVMQQARVCLAPLRFGAGLKGKLFDAMLSGTPSVTTTIGAESMHEDLRWNGIISDDPAEIALAAIFLYTQQDHWLSAQKAGIEIINNCFLKDNFGSRLLCRIAEIRNTLVEHRLKNFTGAMLMHHTMASTKFMSRWIEAKNSKQESSKAVD